MPDTKTKLDIACLTIAGSDSCGGAGIQADLKTFENFEVYGASVITAITAQNTLGVHAAEAISAKMIGAQLDAVLDDLPIRAIKTGMLPDARAIEAICEILQRRGQGGIPLVVDPVLVATSGAALTLEDTITALKEWLFPLATLITPNLAEVRALAGDEDRDDPEEAARGLLSLGCGAVLLKGGHGESDTVTDILMTREDTRAFRHPYVKGDYHGTGCVLSSAIAAQMAKGTTLGDAVSLAVEFVQSAIAGARSPARGPLGLIT